MEAIGVCRKTLELTPPGHSLRDEACYRLAESLREELKQTDNQDQLMEIIQLHKEALELRPPGHPLRDYSFVALAVALTRRFEEGGELI
jgi:hypothetical protein